MSPLGWADAGESDLKRGRGVLIPARRLDVVFTSDRGEKRPPEAITEQISAIPTDRR